MTTKPELEIHYADEWAALYVDGKLNRVGDSYLAEEKAFEILGVKIVQDDAFLRGQTSREGCAQTLTDVVEYARDRQHRQDEAQRLRDEALARMTRAAELEKPSTA